MRPQEFDSFVAAQGQPLRQLAYLICGDIGRAEDAAQTALEKLYSRWGSVSDPVTYARRVTINCARDNWRRHGRWESPSASMPELASQPDEVIEDGILLRDALRRLPTRQRAVVILRHWLDLSEQETANLLGLSVGTVKSHNSRALKSLRQAITGTETAHPDLRRT